MMLFKLELSEPVLVYSPPVNDATKKWGVYAIPRMWRDISGKLIVRFNGEIDTGDTDNMQAAPNLYFTSDDDGESWSYDENGEEKYPIDILNGLDSPYTNIGNGKKVAFGEKQGRLPIDDNVPHQKEFVMPNGEALVYSYKYGDIPTECKGFEKITFSADGTIADISDADIIFDDREILINAKGFNFTEFVDVEKRVKQGIFKNPYFSSVTVLADGTLGAVACGQNPEVCDHYNGAVYLISSADGGKTWRKRSVIAMSDKMPYGYGGDGHETSLTRTSDNTLVCAMRMEMSINPDVATPICDTMICISKDDGHSWCKPFSASDSSVTPHVVALSDNIVVLVYGRPGVHIKISKNGGETWSDSVSVIGNTLEECHKMGIKDSDSKYFNTSSYSNTFCEKLDDDSFLLLYNDMKYDEGDGVFHKAAFVRKITVKKDKSSV